MASSTSNSTAKMASFPSHAISPEEHFCLKSALAFMIVRKRRETKNQASNDDKQQPPLIRALAAAAASRQHSSAAADVNHLNSILSLAVTTALPLYNNSDTVFDYLCLKMHDQQIQATLEGLCKHLSVTLSRNSDGNTSARILDSLKRQVSSSQEQDTSTAFLAWCTVWLGVLQQCDDDEGATKSSSIGSALLAAIGSMLQDIHHDHLVLTLDADVVVVNLIHLVQAIVWIRLLVPTLNDDDEAAATTTSQQQQQAMVQELAQALSHELIMPVPVCEMACFVNASRSNAASLPPTSKLLLRLALYDIVEQASKGY